MTRQPFSEPGGGFGPPPPDVEPLDRLLQQIRFEARASLAPEVLGLLERAARPRIEERPWLGSALRLTGIALALGAMLALGWAAVLQARPHRTVDRCCWDLDGGGPADDGVVVTMDRGGHIRQLAVYEDPDGNRRFDRGDAVRFRRAGGPVLTDTPAGTNTSAVTREVCCADLDGGGRPDDALLLIGRPPDVLTMVAVVERGGGNQHGAPLR